MYQSVVMLQILQLSFNPFFFFFFFFFGLLGVVGPPQSRSGVVRPPQIGQGATPLANNGVAGHPLATPATPYVFLVLIFFVFNYYNF